MVSLTNICMVFTAKPRKCLTVIFKWSAYCKIGVISSIHWCIRLLVYGLCHKCDSLINIIIEMCRNK